MGEAGFDLGALQHGVLSPLELQSQDILLAPAIPTMGKRALPDPGESGRKQATAFTPQCNFGEKQDLNLHTVHLAFPWG